MKKLTKEFFTARKLRERGFSLKEISEKLGIAKSTASIWLSGVSLPDEALKRLAKRRLLGGLRAANSNRRRGAIARERVSDEARKLLVSIPVRKSHLLLFCALLFECEGAKNTSSLEFINSSPLMISGFLAFLRNSFDLDEKKFRITMHLHQYHDEAKQKKFWAKVSGINRSQFTKTYLKPNTGKNYREGYPGCIRVRYGDSKIAKKLQFIAREILENYGSVR